MRPPKDNEVRDQDYIFTSKSSFLTLTIIAFFVIGLIVNFPLKKISKNFIESRLATSLPCPISYDSLDVEFFFPKIIFNQLIISKDCLDSQKDLKLKKSMIIFRGIGLTPLGPKAVLQAESSLGTLSIAATQTWGKQVISIEDTQINLQGLSDLFTNAPKVVGQIMIKARADLDPQKNLLGLKATISSDNLEIPVQKVMGFDIPSLPLRQLLLKADLTKKNVINILDLRIGTDKGPIRGGFKGLVYYTPQMPSSSELDLQGQIGFSNSFLDKFPILPRVILKRFDIIDGFYQMKLKGTLGRPLPTSI